MPATTTLSNQQKVGSKLTRSVAGPNRLRKNNALFQYLIAPLQEDMEDLRNDPATAQNVILGDDSEIRNVDGHIHHAHRGHCERRRPLNRPHRVLYLRQRVVCIRVSDEGPDDAVQSRNKPVRAGTAAFPECRPGLEVVRGLVRRTDCEAGDAEEREYAKQRNGEEDEEFESAEGVLEPDAELEEGAMHGEAEGEDEDRDEARGEASRLNGKRVENVCGTFRKPVNEGIERKNILRKRCCWPPRSPVQR